MKLFTTLMLLLLCSLPASAQKKGKVDKDMLIDSLSKTNASMTTLLDSTSKQLVNYQAMHKAIQEKVIKYNFAPERTGELIDSLKTAREKTFSTLSADSKALNDSVTVLAAENAEVKAKMAAMEAAAKSNEVVTSELRKLKELLDEKILTQAEFDERKAKIMKGW